MDQTIIVVFVIINNFLMNMLLVFLIYVLLVDELRWLLFLFPSLYWWISDTLVPAILASNRRTSVVRSPFPAILYEASLPFSKLLSIVSSKILGSPNLILRFEVSAVQIFKGLRQIKNYDLRADPSPVRPVGYPRRKSMDSLSSVFFTKILMTDRNLKLRTQRKRVPQHNQRITVQ